MPRQLTARRIIYLDFDGVLHDDEVYRDFKRGIYLRTPGRSLFEWEKFLSSLLVQHSDVRIVLSTSWVPIRGYNYTRNRLSSTLRSIVIGSTFHGRFMHRSEFMSLPRGVQIAQDAARREPQFWLAIDDDDDQWPRYLRDKLICTDGGKGLSAPEIQLAVSEWLKKTSNSYCQVDTQKADCEMGRSDKLENDE